MRLNINAENRKRLYALVVCAVGIASLLVACDGGTYLKGVVLDSADKPVADADVRLAVGNRTLKVKSSEYGVFKIGTLHSPYNPELSLSVAKAGYRSFEKRFHANEHLQSIVITLQRASDIGGSGSPPSGPDSTSH